MKTLWTPWRMEHVDGLAPREPGCLFEPSFSVLPTFFRRFAYGLCQ